MSPYLNKSMRKFNVFDNIIYQKYEPTQSLFYSFFCYQFDIYFYVGSFDEESTEDMGEKNFELLRLIISEIRRILLAFSYFLVKYDHHQFFLYCVKLLKSHFSQINHDYNSVKKGFWFGLKPENNNIQNPLIVLK